MITRYFYLCFCLLATAPLFGQNNYTEVTLAELMKKKTAGDKEMVIVDVRTRGEYNDSSRAKSGNIGRIRSAINIPLQELLQDPKAIHQFDGFKDKDIYLICSHSYRSRTVSAMLLKNGFTHVNNIRGGMTEWYRRYDELLSYRDQLDQSDISYKNVSPAELLGSLEANEKPLLIGIRNTARFFWDSGNVVLYKYFPLLKEAQYFDLADSLQLLELAGRQMQRPIILFSMVNSGGAEMADWLTKKGIAHAGYLVGGINLLYEYVINKIGKQKASVYFSTNSSINFITPANYCAQLPEKKMQVIDLRPDSIFTRRTEGVKHTYTHFRDAVNFHFSRGISEFEKTFPDKSKAYLFFNAFGSDGIELADALTTKGYKIAWMIGGYDRWEWYMNNVEDFKCNELSDK